MQVLLISNLVGSLIFNRLRLKNGGTKFWGKSQSMRETPSSLSPSANFVGNGRSTFGRQLQAKCPRVLPVNITDNIVVCICEHFDPPRPPLQVNRGKA